VHSLPAWVRRYSAEPTRSGRRTATGLQPLVPANVCWESAPGEAVARGKVSSMPIVPAPVGPNLSAVCVDLAADGSRDVLKVAREAELHHRRAEAPLLRREHLGLGRLQVAS